MLTYFIAVGVQLDEFLCALIFGVRGVTISLHAALEAKAGRRWACWLCAVLSWLVQHDHCADQLAGKPMTLRNYTIAFGALGMLAYGLHLAMTMALSFLFTALLRLF